MKKETITIKGKIFKSIPIEFEAEYSWPENPEEAIEMDGESKMMKLYLNERKTTFMDKLRNSYIKAAEKKALEDPSKAAQLKAILGIG